MSPEVRGSPGLLLGKRPVRRARGSDSNATVYEPPSSQAVTSIRKGKAMLAQEGILRRILRRIESAGYRVTGCRDAIGDGQDGPLVVTAEHRETGERHTVSVDTKGSAGEIEAFRRLAEKVGMSKQEKQKSVGFKCTRRQPDLAR